MGVAEFYLQIFVGMLVSRIGVGSGSWASVPLWCILLPAFFCISFELLIERRVLCVIQICLVQNTLLPATIWCCGQVVELKVAKRFVVLCSTLTKGLCTRIAELNITPI